jgi:predicted RND superfamily exporter protein
VNRRREWNPFLRFPRTALLAAALAGLPLVRPLARFTVSAEPAALLAGDQRSLAAYQQARAIFGENELVAVSLEAPDLFTPAGLERVGRLTEALGQLPGVLELKSLTHAVHPVRRGFRFEMVPLLPAPPWDAARLAAFRDFCLSHPLIRNVMVSADGRHTLVTATLTGRAESAAEREAFCARLDAALAPFRAAGWKLQVLALPLVERELRATLRRDVTRFVPAAAGMVLGVLALALRSPRLVLFALANQAAVLVLLPGVFHLAGRPLTVFTVPVLPLVTGVHLTLLLHLLTAWRQAHAAGAAGPEALRATLAVVQRPAAFSALTTVLGLLALAAGGAAPMREFGLLGAAGVGAAWAFTFGPTVALFELGVAGRAGPTGANRRRSDWARVRAVRWVEWLERRRAWLRASAGVAAVAAVAGLAQVRTDVHLAGLLPPGSATRRTLETWEQVYGGYHVVQIEFDTGTPNGVNAPAFLRYLDAVHRLAAARPEPTGVYSYAQVLALANQVWEGGRPEARRLPENPLQIALFTAALRAGEFPFLAALADAEFRTACLVVRTPHLPARRYLNLIAGIVREAERLRPPGVTVSAARGLHTLLEADRQLLRGQAVSALLAAAVIGLTLAGLWRSVRLAGLALGVNAVPVALALAGAGWTGVPLNSVTVMVGALALGVVVDDAVHLLTHWQAGRRAGLTAREALGEALRVKGPAVVWTSVILIGVCGLFAASSFPPVRQFGALLAGAFAAALVAVLGWLPLGLWGVQSAGQRAAAGA